MVLLKMQKDPNKSVGILKGSKVTHIAPPGDIINSLVKELFDYLKKTRTFC